MLLKVVGGVVLALVIVLGVAFFAFVPCAKEPAYIFAKAWGAPGSGPGQFDDPTGIAVAGNEIFVADSRNGRIQVFDLEGNFKREFGKPGEGSGELGRPMNLTVHDGELYVPEYFNDRIQVFALDGKPRRTIGEPGDGPGQFNAPGGVAVAENGDLFVADFYNHRIQYLKADGTFVAQWGMTGEPGRWAGDFTYPTDAAMGADGAVYVADGYGDRIQVFTPDDGFLRKWGGPFALDVFGPFNGWFAVATSVAIGPEGNLFAADFYNDRVQKFAPDGTFRTDFGGTGSGPGQFRHAMAVALADDGSVFIADFLNNRIQPRGGAVFFFNRAAETMFGFQAEEVLGRRIGVLMPRHSRQVYRGCVCALGPGRDMRWEGTARRKGSGEFPLEATLSCQDFDGRPVLIICARDISERQRAREHDELLLREVEHRVKNLLASVQALARQTLCASPSPEIFAERFTDRLAALSRVQALLIQSRWQGAALHDLVGAELSPYRSEERRDAAIKGDPVFLDPEPALALSLALHELTTNAAKYGALSTPEGRAEISWKLEDRGAEWYLMLQWAELGGPEVQEPERRGFGSTLLEQGVISTLGGTVDLGFPSEGVRCRIELPVNANPEGQP